MNSHRKGWAWQRKVELWLESAGFRTTTRGIGFVGDDILARRFTSGGWELQLSVECKNTQEISLSKFVDQAVTQAGMYPPENGVLPASVIHRRGRDDVDQAYVVLPGWAFIELVTR